MTAKSRVDPAPGGGGSVLGRERTLAAHRFIHFFDRRIRALYQQAEGGPCWQVLFALGSKDELAATKIATELQLHRGYLGRIPNAFLKRAIIAAASSDIDGNVRQPRRMEQRRKSVGLVQRQRDFNPQPMFAIARRKMLVA
jgi:hypothetical protein